MADQLEHAHFEGKEGESFTAKAEEDSLNVKLVGVSEREDEHTKGFSLLFEGPAETQLRQGLYTVAHDDVGEHEIFLVPVMADPMNPDVVHYEAVFNRLKDESRLKGNVPS